MVGNKINLRALEPDDLSFLYLIENNIDNWSVSETTIPFSNYLLHQYLDNLNNDIYSTKQLRLVIEQKLSKEAIGIIDLFDFDPANSKCGIGIIINPEFQKKGYGLDAISVLLNYCKNTLNLNQVYCDIQSNNATSISFFAKNSFIKTCTKKDWYRKGNKYFDVLLFQKFL